MSQNLSLHDLSILLVEPSSTQARIIVEHLANVGLNKIEVVHNGRDALTEMKRHVPDLVLSAMYFEDMTGSDLVETMRSDSMLEYTPFILVSSETHPHNLEPIRQAGVLAILPKPFDLADLKRALYGSLEFLDPEALEVSHIDVEDLRVLVVDDSRFSQRHIQHILHQLGIEHISLAPNGREAAELIRDERFDLVVTDYNMPEMDGQQLVSYIRNLSDQPELPVLMVTCERDDSRLASVRQAGVSALCDKPFDVANIREIARNLLTL
ncbi:two-component system response regulator [Alkalilimnicola ehrlichii]|uniref:Two-component system response regulator n=1 Tax=Alkalilimnicola ehrlichii TaxID=351052 RepID=A0A3E0WWL4_9GAMM|nr:response regulator [Alkalilimnicola ehrlichii]RFA29960.1 two-component system response regulator [Alkalilimnicola ehrlichii]RFA36551.1 two-component system response regulator [Alkalilimnicola ehrlichii]